VIHLNNLWDDSIGEARKKNKMESAFIESLSHTIVGPEETIGASF
jgi:hypothetical protein